MQPGKASDQCFCLRKMRFKEMAWLSVASEKSAFGNFLGLVILARLHGPIFCYHRSFFLRCFVSKGHDAFQTWSRLLFHFILAEDRPPK